MDNDMVDWEKKMVFRKPRIIRIPSGAHSFSAQYTNGSQYTFAMTVIGQFDRGKTYLLKSNVQGMYATMHIVEYENMVEGEEVTLDLNKLRGNDPSTISVFIKNIINPTSIEVGNSVKQANEDYVLLFMPDMAYTLTDKKTGTAIQGRWGFSMDFRMTNAQVFLLETDIDKMSQQEFLDGNYQDDAQTVLIPVKCSETEVTYRYERPDDLKGTELVFNITEIKK
jgi:hypothetical protein